MEGISEELENVGVFFMGGTPSVVRLFVFMGGTASVLSHFFFLFMGARID